MVSVSAETEAGETLEDDWASRLDTTSLNQLKQAMEGVKNMSTSEVLDRIREF